MKLFLTFAIIVFFSSMVFAQNKRLDNQKKVFEQESKPQGTSDTKASQARDLNDELAIGREMAAKLYGTYGQFDADKNKLRYLNLIAQSMTREVGRSEIIFRVGILDTDELNAFATPGGYILITKGLLNLIKSEEELAGVLAHEIGHINNKHLYKSVAPKREVSVGETLTRIISLGKADLGASLIKSVQEGMKTLLDQGLKPELEFEADQNAVSYTWSTGYSHKAYVTLLERLAASVETKSHVLKTHPSFTDRLVHLKKFIDENNLNETRTPATSKRDSRFQKLFF
jgi:predicted Zn-dependent protease